VVGLKPTYGLLPTEGVTPLARSFDTVGIIAGTVAHARAALHAMGPALPVPDKFRISGCVAIEGLFATVEVPSSDALHGASGALRDMIGCNVPRDTLAANVVSIVSDHCPWRLPSSRCNWWRRYRCMLHPGMSWAPKRLGQTCRYLRGDRSEPVSMRCGADRRA
jgi:hypothetical protein